MLALDEVKKRFGSVQAVDGVSLHIDAGEMVGLLGPNGAGKTTTISMATGLLQADEGRVELEGFGSPGEFGARRAIGVAPQALAIYDELTGVENLRFMGSLYGLRGRQLAQRADELLERVGLTEACRRRAGTYSGGMKRRLNLAMAMTHDPLMLLLDEPTAGVDPQSRNAIFDLVASEKEKGRAILYTTHYMEEAQRLCDRVMIMDHGKTLAFGTVDALIAEHGGDAVLVIEDRTGEVERRFTKNSAEEVRAVLSNGEAATVTVERPNLEGVFLNLTGRSLRD